MKKFDPFAQVHDHRMPCLDGIKSAVATGTHAGQTVAAGGVPGIADNLNEQETAKAKKAGEVVSADANEDRQQEIRNGATPAAWKRQDPYATEDSGMSWGRSGMTECTRERNAEVLPASAMQGAGIQPQNVSTTSPVPRELGRPMVPDRDHDQSWNMNDIINYRI
jgi:hypothetical protein